MYINKVKQMSDMSYTFEQFEQDKQTLLNLIADCEELEKKSNKTLTSFSFNACWNEFAQEKYIDYR